MLSRPDDINFFIHFSIAFFAILSFILASIYLLISLGRFERRTTEGYQSTPWRRRIGGSAFLAAMMGMGVWNILYLVYALLLAFATASKIHSVTIYWFIVTSVVVLEGGLLFNAFVMPRIVIPAAFSFARAWRAAMRSAFVLLFALAGIAIMTSYILDTPVYSATMIVEQSQFGLRLSPMCFDCDTSYPPIVRHERGTIFIDEWRSTTSLLFSALMRLAGGLALQFFVILFGRRVLSKTTQNI